MIVTLAAIGFGVATLSGLLGIGGAIILIPALLYLPPALGVGTLDMRTVAGISMMQVLFASLSGVVAHRRNRFVSRQLVLWMGLSILLGSFLGGVLSRDVSNRTLEGLFASLALAAAGLMLLPRAEERGPADPDAVPFARPLAAAIAFVVGCLAGMVGAGGAFILVPAMIYVLGVPTRIAVGSTLGVVFLSAAAGAAGKIATGQVHFGLAAALVAGAVPGAQVGAWASARTPVGALRGILAALIAATGARMWLGLLAGL